MREFKAGERVIVFGASMESGDAAESEGTVISISDPLTLSWADRNADGTSSTRRFVVVEVEFKDYTGTTTKRTARFHPMQCYRVKEKRA